MSPGRFPRFVAASGGANLADGVAVVAWAWLASRLTRDPFLVALAVAAIGALALALLGWRPLGRGFAAVRPG